MVNVDSICGIYLDFIELFLEMWIEGKWVFFKENVILKEDV